MLVLVERSELRDGWPREFRQGYSPAGNPRFIALEQRDQLADEQGCRRSNARHGRRGPP